MCAHTVVIGGVSAHGSGDVDVERGKEERLPM